MTDFTTLRTAMVDCQVRPSDVTKFPVIEAMLTVPREVFVPAEKRGVAYAGAHVELGGGRVIMDPRILAKLLDALDIKPDELVLDLGCGLGYSTALIAHLAEAVIAVESDPDLAAEAEANLETQSVDNAFVIHAPLIEGAAKHGPYDAVLVGGAVQKIPASIVDQIKDGGRIAAIFSKNASGECRLGVKSGGRVAWRAVFDATAPVLPEFADQPEFSL